MKWGRKMLIKSLFIKNFRQFLGETEIEFSCDKFKNVTVILGDNTFGKTTLLQTFNWCLYDFVVFDKDSNPEFLLNLELATKMIKGSSEDVEVRLILIHNKTEYTIVRTQNYFWTDKGVRSGKSQVSISYKAIGSDGQTDIREQYIANLIDEILPKSLSNYFFFDTERVRDVSNRQDVTESVKGLLGLTALDNALKHLGSKTQKTTVIGKLYASMDTDGDNRASEALSHINSLQAKKTEIATQLSDLKIQISDYELEKERIDLILKDNQSTAQLQDRKMQIERLIKTETDTLQICEGKFLLFFSRGSMCFFSKPMMENALSFLKNTNVDDKGIKDMTAQSIREIIDRGICICGREIVEGTDPYEYILGELKFVPPESIGTTIRNFKEKIGFYDAANRTFYEELKSKYEDIIRMRTRVSEWTDEMTTISKKIQGKDDMKIYEDKLIDAKRRLKEFAENRDKLIRDDESCKNDIERHQKTYDGLVAVSSKNKTIMQNIRYAEEIFEWIAKTYKEREDDIREKLEERVNNIFTKIYHGQRRVIINAKYQVSLLTMVADQEIKTGESEGLNRVKNFAFIAGLVDLAKEKINTSAGSEEIDLSSEPYPLVMDAPFSNADAIHTANISKILPEVAEQVIMFVMEKDWKYAEPVILYRVGEKYLLNKKTDTLTYLKRS